VIVGTFFVNIFQYDSLYWLVSRYFVRPVTAASKLLNERTSQEKRAKAAFAKQWKTLNFQHNLFPKAEMTF
jgi:hypothetical protein